MKRILLCIGALFCLLLTMSTVALAHSGRTDGSGGHNCSEKSIAKGLCTGYHYHNGGGSSSAPAKTTPAPSYDKNCSDFSSYDEMIAYWNEKGYSATYDPENLDGWGKNVVDDGIPCEAPADYDLTKINNSPQQQVAKQEAVDREKATTLGEKNGYADGYANNDKAATVTGSDVYVKQYATSYIQSYEEGVKKREAEIKAIYDEGYNVGKKNEKLAVPSAYAQTPMYQQAFERGHKAGYEAYIKQQAPLYYEQGLQHGEADVYEKPNVTASMWLEQYEKGYNEAQETLKKAYEEQGYQLAYTTLTYDKEGVTNEKFAAWHEAGFKRNTIVSELQPIAYAQGKNGEDLAIPEKYEQAAVLYEQFYNEGYEEYVNPVPYVVTGLVALGGGGVLLYRRKRKRQHKKTIR